MNEPKVDRRNKLVIALVLAFAGMALFVLLAVTVARSHAAGTTATAPAGDARAPFLPTITSDADVASPASTGGNGAVKIIPTSSEAGTVPAPGTVAATDSTGAGTGGTSSPTSSTDGAALVAQTTSGTPPAANAPAPDSSAAQAPSSAATPPQDVKKGSNDNDASKPVPAEKAAFKLPGKFSLDFESIYDSNIYIRHTGEVGDYYFTMTPGYEYENRQPDADLDDKPEDYFHFLYQAEFAKFVDQTNNDFVDHNALGTYIYEGPTVTVGTDVHWFTSHYPNVDFGGRLKADYYTADQYLIYPITDRLTFGTEVNEVLSRYAQGIDSSEYADTSYLDYELGPRTTIGFGFTDGYINLETGSPDQYYEKGLLRMTYKVTQKLNLSIQAGVEHEYDGGTALFNPCVVVSANYTPIDGTTLQLSGIRHDVPSITQVGVSYQDSAISLTWHQQLTQGVYLHFSTSYEHDNYYNVISGDSIGLLYDFVVVRPSVEWDLNDNVKLSAFYEWQDNAATPGIVSFEDHSAGVGATFTY